MLYHSDSWVVVHFAAQAGSGFEIVDRRSGRETVLRGSVAERFEREARALSAQGGDAEAMDDFIEGFAGAGAALPLVLH